MKTILVLWNPDESPWNRDEHEMCLDAQRVRAEHYSAGGRERFGPRLVTNYSTHALDIEPGDRVLMLMVGKHVRGITRDGVVLREPFVDGHWQSEPPARPSRYIVVEWWKAVPLDNPLPTEVLVDRLPEVPWKQYRNASSILDTHHPQAVPVLERLWAEHRGVAPMLEPTCKGSVGPGR